MFCLLGQSILTEGREHIFLEYELEFGTWELSMQVKAFRFNLVATEAHQMVFGKEN